ncbi:MAG TPA: hypothetical protein VLK33_22745 [Terriglobales bacterium]|nr:hypothetical protein [Terriglobales bacterium]
MARYWEIVFWLAIGAATAPIWGAVLWVLWQGVVRPHLVPRGEVERLAALLVERHGERAEEVAFGEEYGAWRNSDGFSQGKWRRVRKLIEEQGVTVPR